MRRLSPLFWLILFPVSCRFDSRGVGAGESVDSGQETTPEDVGGESCFDGVRTGAESDVDCGGPDCPKCGVGSSCRAPVDCVTGICGLNSKCATPSCTDGLKDGKESDVDCGGPDCPSRCADGLACSAGADCASGVCDDGGKCAVASCTDKVANGVETDVDCGGGTCPACGAGKKCKVTSDCPLPLTCTAGVCAPATSCKALLAARPGLASAAYSIDPDGAGPNAPFEAYCDMTTDGGGWTFFAHVNQNYGAGRLFEADVGLYRSDRADNDSTYGRGGSLAYLEHTSMMLVIDGSDPAVAASANRLLVFSYALGAEGFSKGPIPCSGLTGSFFSYRTTLTGPFTASGTTNACDTARWHTRTAGDFAYLTAFNASAFGNHWGAGMGGTDTANHDGWWYAR